MTFALVVVSVDLTELAMIRQPEDYKTGDGLTAPKAKKKQATKRPVRTPIFATIAISTPKK